MSETDLEKERRQMVENQIISRGIGNEAVLEAFRTVPRHIFVPDRLKERAYEDNPLPIGEGQTISQPYIVALMIAALEPEESDNILEVGTGSGFAAAVLSRIVSRVYSIERYEVLADRAREVYAELGYDNIEVIAADGSSGWPEKAPFDGILVSAAAPRVTETLKKQLKPGGNLVIPVGDKTMQDLIQIKYDSSGKYREKSLGLVRFVPLIGKKGWKSDL